jgi:long-subunit fatty acid transport protein
MPMMSMNGRVTKARVGITFALAACLVLSAGSVFAQSGQTAQIPLQFDFLNPGARSLAMGSAFVAVADDATAAFTNPAGLTFLVKPEVSGELRYRSLDTPFLYGGRLNGTVTNVGTDTTAGPTYATSTDSSTRPYFLSFVYPGKQWAVSVYRHELVRQDNSFQSNGAYFTAVFSGTPVTAQMAGLQGTRTVTIDNYGVSAAYRVTDRVSAGAGVSIYHFDVTSDFTQLGHDAAGNPIPVASAATMTQRGSGTSAAANLGLLWTADPKVRLGVVFRQGAGFDFTQVDTVPPLGSLTRTGQFRTPHVFGLGARVQPMGNFSFSVDYDRVLYSRLKDDYISFQVADSVKSRIDIADGNEVHVGAEYVFTSVAHTPSIRGGLWYDPDHSVHYTSDGTNSVQDLQLKAIFPGGDNVAHYCFGVGVPVSPAFEFNVGADLAKNRHYVSGSVVARFGK